MFLLGVLLFAGYSVGLATESALPLKEHLAGRLSVDDIIASLKRPREASVSFEERTYSYLLTEPLVTRGMLRFMPPSTLEKEVLQPYHERYVIEGDRVTFESERKHVKKTMSLDDYPPLRAMVETFRVGLTGEAERLKQMYDLTGDGNQRGWTLMLRPRHGDESMRLDHIILSGSEGDITAIEIYARDGDRSVMTLSRGHAP